MPTFSLEHGSVATTFLKLLRLNLEHGSVACSRLNMVALQPVSGVFSNEKYA